MTTTFFLVRHAAHDNLGGFLAGRTSGIRLGPSGRAQAERLAERMRRESFAAIHASPRERSQETAYAISTACGVGPVETDAALDEIDFGDWSGRTFAELNEEPDWQFWNSDRGRARTPAGETADKVRNRVLDCMQRGRSAYPERAVVLVSHADVIKAAICHILDLPAEACAKFDISPASITTVVSGDWGARILTLNETVH
jgi:broad specificity phosphatase PhoE